MEGCSISPIVQWSCSNTGKENGIWIPWAVTLYFYTDHSACVWEAAREPASKEKGQGKDVLPVADAFQNLKMSFCIQKFIFTLTYGRFIIHFNSPCFSKEETPWVAEKQCLEMADYFLHLQKWCVWCLAAAPDTSASFCTDKGCSSDTHTPGKEQPDPLSASTQLAFQWLWSTGILWWRTPISETF